MGALSIRSVSAALLALVALAAPAAAAPPARQDGMDEPVFLVHGYTSKGTDCAQRWNTAIKAWRGAGWKGFFHRVGYYANDDESCGTKIAAADTSTSIRDLGAQLAHDIYLRYSLKRQSVDIVGHSMGGLVARVAITGTSRGWAGFPPYVYVEDAVTLGTPHGGVTADWVDSCSTTQCVQMRPGSKFLSVLGSVGKNPQSAQGTDWTLIGSEEDRTVAWQSAVASRELPTMTPGHRILYKSGGGISHGDYPSTVSGDHNYQVSYFNSDASAYSTNGGVKRTPRGRSPVYMAGSAIKRWKDW